MHRMRRAVLAPLKSARIPLERVTQIMSTQGVVSAHLLCYTPPRSSMGGKRRTVNGKEVCQYVYFLVGSLDSLGNAVRDVVSLLRLPKTVAQTSGSSQALRRIALAV